MQNKNDKIIDWDMSGADIEAESFRRIDEEMGPHDYGETEWRIIRRLIHTTADFSIADNVDLRHDPVNAGIEAVRDGAPIYCDSNMLASGISVKVLQQYNQTYSRDSISCLVGDPAVAVEAKRRGVARSLVAIEKAQHVVDGGIVLIGNAPLALAALARMIEKDEVKPRLVIGMPVGFVHVLESKEMLQRTEVPQVVLQGRRGGSPLAVAAFHGIINTNI